MISPALANSTSSLGKVAENSRVCLVSGSLLIISWSCSAKPISKSLSGGGASSRSNVSVSQPDLTHDNRTRFAVSPVGLVEHHILHSVQLQVHFLHNVHETTGSANDSDGGGRGGVTSHTTRQKKKMRIREYSHVGVFMKGSKLILHTGEEAEVPFSG